jgi:replicative DNA helicase
LKSIAKELNVPIIALSQLSRAVESRTDKRPQLSDLRESGAIEQDADMVLFIYRPEYYNMNEDNDGNPTDGLAEIIIAKHRNGSLKNVNLRFIDHLAKFTDMQGADFITESFSANADREYGKGNIIRSSRMNDMSDDAHEPPF